MNSSGSRPPPSWHTVLPWQQPHALPQPSPCQRWSYSLTAGTNSGCRHLTYAYTHTLKYINANTLPSAKAHTLASLLMFQIEDAGVCHLSLFVSASPSPQALTDAPACRVCAYMYHGVTLCVHTHTHKDTNITHNVHLQDSNVNLVSEGHECLMK